MFSSSSIANACTPRDHSLSSAYSRTTKLVVKVCAFYATMILTSTSCHWKCSSRILRKCRSSAPLRICLIEQNIRTRFKYQTRFKYVNHSTPQVAFTNFNYLSVTTIFFFFSLFTGHPPQGNFSAFQKLKLNYVSTRIIPDLGTP